MPYHDDWIPASPQELGYATFTYPGNGTVIRPYYIRYEDVPDIPAIGDHDGTVREYGFPVPDSELERIFDVKQVVRRPVDDALIAVIDDRRLLAKHIGLGTIVTDDALPPFLQIKLNFSKKHVNRVTGNTRLRECIFKWGSVLRDMLYEMEVSDDGTFQAKAFFEADGILDDISSTLTSAIVFSCSITVYDGLDSTRARWRVHLSDAAGNGKRHLASGEVSASLGIADALRDGCPSALELAALKMLNYLDDWSDGEWNETMGVIERYFRDKEKVRKAEEVARLAELEELRRKEAEEQTRLDAESRRNAVREAKKNLCSSNTSTNVACGGYVDFNLPRDVLDSVFSVYDNAYEPELDYIYDPYFEEQWL